MFSSLQEKNMPALLFLFFLSLPHATRPLAHARSQSGYRLPLGLETVPLVHRLFADLIALGKGANEVRVPK